VDEMAKILILSEQPSAREFIAEELAGEGHLVVVIGSPSLIGELLTTLEPDLVLQDFLKRSIDLRGALEEIKRAHLPVFTFTSYGRYKEEIRFEVTNQFGIETFSLEILKRKVADVLKRKTIQEFREVRHDLSLPRTQIPLSKAKDQKDLMKKFQTFHP
jgi:DNA-binding NtrC family response regulator